jgi:energy-coupling factor transport system ATP-binding protein
MALQPDNPPEAVVSAIYVHELSFRYRINDDEPGAATEEPFRQTRAIEGISFSLPKGELMLIAGPSGCGKSTLLKCLNGLIPHSYPGTLSGEILLEGRPISGLSLRDLAKQVGTMLQDPDKQILGSTVESVTSLAITYRDMVSSGTGI